MTCLCSQRRRAARSEGRRQQTVSTAKEARDSRGKMWRRAVRENATKAWKRAGTLSAVPLASRDAPSQ